MCIRDSYSAGNATKDGQITGLITDDNGSHLNTFSNYDDGTHNGGFVEANIFREHGATQGYISADMVGTYRMTFKAKKANCGDTNSDNGATGGTCHAFVKVLNAGDFSLMLFERVETTSTSADAFTEMVLDYEITEGMVGNILQTGFMNYAGNYAPTGMLYDDCLLYTSPSPRDRQKSRMPSSA